MKIQRKNKGKKEEQKTILLTGIAPEAKSTRERVMEEELQQILRWKRLTLGCMRTTLQSGCRPIRTV